MKQIRNENRKKTGSKPEERGSQNGVFPAGNTPFFSIFSAAVFGNDAAEKHI